MAPKKRIKKETSNENIPAKVLIADDDEATRILLRMALTQWGYEVVEARDGEEAWKILQEANPPQLLTLDWLMPKLDGISLCKRIDAELDFRPYIIFLTRMGGTENVIQGLEAGADEFIIKPFDLTELRIRIFAGERIIKYRLQLADQNRQLRQYAASIEALAARYTKQEESFSVVTGILQEASDLLKDAMKVSSDYHALFQKIENNIKMSQTKLREIAENAKELVREIKANKILHKKTGTLVSVPPQCIIQENESVLNMQRMHAFFGKNNAAIQDFIKTFITLATEQVNEIDAAIKNKDMKSAKYYFHLLGSASGNSGMMRIYEICGVGEEKSTHSDWEAALECYKSLRILIEKLKQEADVINKN